MIVILYCTHTQKIILYSTTAKSQVCAVKLVLGFLSVYTVPIQSHRLAAATHRVEVFLFFMYALMKRDWGERRTRSYGRNNITESAGPAEIWAGWPALVLAYTIPV